MSSCEWGRVLVEFERMSVGGRTIPRLHSKKALRRCCGSELVRIQPLGVGREGGTNGALLREVIRLQAVLGCLLLSPFSQLVVLMCYSV
jgi:hypothetical protein